MSPSPLKPIPPLTGKVATVLVLGTKNTRADAVRAILTMKVGDTYTPETVHKDLAAIKGLGVFNTVSDTETADPAGGVDVTYTVSENPIVTAIKITADTPTGKPSVPEADLIAHMKTQAGRVLNTNLIVQDMNSLFNHTDGYFLKQGYLADVGSGINVDPKTGVLAIPLTEDRIRLIKIEGNRHVKTADILARMQAKAGDIYDSNILNGDKSLIFEMGGFREVQDGRGTIAEPGKIDVTIPVVEQASATGVLDEARGKVIPFLYDPITAPFPVVQVSIDGKPPLSFIVDTGTSAALSLNPWAAQQLGLKMDGPVKQGVQYTYRETPIRTVAVSGTSPGKEVSLTITSAQVQDMEFMSLPFADRHIAGLVGLGALVPYITRFDFAAKTLTVFAGPHPPLSIPGGTVLPLRVNGDGGVFTVRATLVPGSYADLIVDTGSMSTQVPLDALKVLHPTAMAFRGFYERVEGVYACPDLRLSGLTFGALTMPNVAVGTLPSPRTSLGMDLLTGYRLTLDGPNGQLILEPLAHGKRPARGHSGLDIARFGDAWKVSLLEDKLPAQLAGLQVGDEIVTVGGTSIGNLTQMKAGQQLSGITGVPMQVSIRRGSKPITLGWVPVDEFSGSHSVMDGVVMTKAPGDPWIIVDVIKGYPGDRAGLVPGDKITKINTEDVAAMSLIHNAELFGKPSVLLTVDRAGAAKPFMVRLSVPK